MLQVAIAGVSGGGDYCRLDNVLLPMTALGESKLPTGEELLCRVFNAFVASCRTNWHCAGDSYSRRPFTDLFRLPSSLLKGDRLSN